MSSTNSHTFDFGTKELISMVGLSQGDGSLVIKKLLENRMLLIPHDKLHVKEVKEIVRQTAYFQKMQQLEKSRKEKSSSSSGSFF
jgi:hypothetical protein